MSIEEMIGNMRDKGGPVFPVPANAEHPGISVRDFLALEILKDLKDTDSSVVEEVMKGSQEIVQGYLCAKGDLESLPSYQKGFADALDTAIKTLCPACASGYEVKHGTHTFGKGECKAWALHKLKTGF